MASQEYTRFLQTLQTRKIPSDSSLEEIRKNFAAFLAEFPPSSEIQIDPCKIGEMPAIWAFAPEVTRRRILLFFHGGAYTAGSIESHKNLIGRLSASANAAVLAVEYRLAPENPFPAALDDALAAYRYLLHHPYSRSRIIFAGISAGAGLALALLLRLKQEQIAFPAGAICLDPWVDLGMKGKSIQSNASKDILKKDLLAKSAEQYAAGRSLADPLLSPLYGDLEGFPPLFIQTGTNDLLHSEALEFAEKAKKNSIATTLDTWPDMIHGWQLFAPSFPEAQEAIDRAGQFAEGIFS